MRVWEIAGSFGLASLRLVERPEPRCGPGHIKLRMRKASLNYRDLMMIRGEYNPRQPLPLVPLSDGVGEVVEVGEGVTRFAVGDRVCPIFAPEWQRGDMRGPVLRSTLGGPQDGVLQEYLVVDANAAVAVPGHLSDAEAACLPCAGVTAWRAVIHQGRLRPGQTLVTLGTGGVSTFALQLGVLSGATVIVTSSSDEKIERAIAMGAKVGINYRREPDWGKRVLELTGGEGADVVVELGGAQTLEQSLRAVRSGGVVALIGVLSGVETKLPLTRIFMRGITVQGVFVGNRDDFEALTSAMSAHPGVRPVVDANFPFEAVPQALDRLARGDHVGKIVIDIA